jgi:hypothetical protein
MSTKQDNHTVTLYATREAADTAKPDKSTLKLFEVTGPENQHWWGWATGSHHVLNAVAKSLGYSVHVAQKPVSREEAQAVLARLSEADRAALIAQLFPSGGKSVAEVFGENGDKPATPEAGHQPPAKGGRKGATAVK